MKKNYISRLYSPLSKTLFALFIAAGLTACDNAIYDYDEDCDPEPETPAPKPDEPSPKPTEPTGPGPFDIMVRTNPGSGGTSAVTHDVDLTNAASTQEGTYVGITVEPNDTYTLTATETNPDYKFVKWHDDTNDGDLTEGQLVISGIKAFESVKYTAIFAKIGDPDPEPEPDPEPGFWVKYVFDMNMQFTDGFSQRVNSVDLYVFNESGSFITKYHEDGVALKDADYLMELKDLPAGTYQLIAWCGLTNNNGHFTVPADAQISQNHHVACTMATLSDAKHSAYQDKNLSPLFHGKKDNAVYVDNNEKQVQTVYLTKNTNNVNITLQHKEGLEFDKSRFTVVMHDNNDYMLHDNSVPTANQEVQYRPYRTAIGTTTSSRKGRASTSATTGNYLQVELATARLMKDNNPTIEITDNESGKTIFSIPLIKWALQLRSSNYKSMGDQEYLDREDNYNLMLWLDNNEDGWFGAEINIIDWHVVDDETSAN